MGDDDLIKKETLVNEIEWLENQHNLVDIYLYGYEIIDNNGKLKKKRKSIQNIFSTNYNSILNNTFMNFVTFPFYYCHPAFYIIKTSFAKEIVLDSSIGIGEDYDFLIRLFNNLDRPNSWTIRNKILFQWRKHQGNSENQSANIYNRFTTKLNIWLKYSVQNRNTSIKLSLFSFLILPMYFDNYSKSLYVEQLKFVRGCSEKLEYRFVRFSFLRFYPFRVFYFFLKVIEYFKVQLLILFL